MRFARAVFRSLEKSETWFGASVLALLIGVTSRIEIDSTPLIVLLFGKSWGFVVFNVVGCFLIGMLCGIREERQRRGK